MADEMVLTEPQGDGVVVLRLNKPPMNPLSRALFRFPLEGRAAATVTAVTEDDHRIVTVSLA